MKTHVDILKLNAIKFSSGCMRVDSPHSLFRCYLSFFYHLLLQIIHWRSWKLPDLKELVFVAPTLNNKKALNPICDNFSEDGYTMLDEYGKQFPYARIYIFSLLHLIGFHKVYRKLSKQDKAVVRFAWGDFILAYGTYKVINQLLRKRQIKVMVFANDHIMVNRCLIELAAEYGIKTLYTQHASVAESFPSLSFSYSFLDGLDSYIKYKACGPITGQVFLSGSPRFDFITKLKGQTNKSAVGIAVNELDSIELLQDLCKYLTCNLNEQIIVRPHPAMEKMSIWSELEKEGYEISYPTKENSFEFANRVRLLIANESGIHLDANLMRTPSVLYNLSTNPVIDVYSYVKNGLMPICSTKEDLLKCIQCGGKIDIEKISYYNAAFGTTYEGNVNVVIAGFIKCMLQDTEMNSIKGIFSLHKKGYYCYM